MTSEEEPQKPAPGPFDLNGKIQELWQGRLPLLQVFWLYYFAVVFVFKIMGDTMGFLGGLFGLFELVWAGFMIKPVMVAADKYKGPRHWALGAKAASVAIGMLVVLDAATKIF